MKNLLNLLWIGVLIIGFVLVYRYVPWARGDMDAQLENYYGIDPSTVAILTTQPQTRSPVDLSSSTGQSLDWGDMPVYPGAVLTYKPSKSGIDSSDEERGYEINGNYEDVTAWYRQEMASKGWQENKNNETPGIDYESYYIKAEAEARVNITAKTDRLSLSLWRRTK
jgi:hypothetical protein